MAKYSTEFKKKIVDEYLKGNIGYSRLAKKHNISSDKQVKIYDGFFFTYKDDVFYSYGSTGFFVIYAEPFQIKLIRNENLSGERRKIVDQALVGIPKKNLNY